MSGLLYLIPIAIVLGLIGLGAFLWALRSGQFDDLDGAAERVLFDDDTATEDNAIDDTADGDRSVEPSDQVRAEAGASDKRRLDSDNRAAPPPRQV